MSPQHLAAQLSTVLAARGHGCAKHPHRPSCKFHIGGMQLIHLTSSEMAKALFVLLCAAALLGLFKMALPSRTGRR